MTELNIFKIEYHWYEDDHEETLLAKAIEREDFEKEIIKAKEFAESLRGIEIKDGEYLGKGYRVDCLPEYYEQIIWFLPEKLGYIICHFDERINYSIDDQSDKKLTVTKSEQKIERSALTCSTQI
jgi:hypothetical protein